METIKVKYQTVKHNNGLGKITSSTLFSFKIGDKEYTKYSSKKQIKKFLLSLGFNAEFWKGVTLTYRC
jgi:hypothetical protein